MKNIWLELKNKKQPLDSARGKPFFVLAPMAGVTDSPFRQMIAKIGKSDLMFTEFCSTELVARTKGTPLVLKFSKKERPLIAQFFGCKVEQFEKSAKLALKLGFDGIDINMGCPDKKVLKQGSGSELINNPELVIEILTAVREVVGNKIPISIKTRLGYEKKNIEYLILNIVRSGLVDAITIHGRTAKQGYSGQADWEEIGRITQIIKKENSSIVVIGNGDIKSLEQGKILAEKYGVDGVMIGRGVLNNPWVFGGLRTEHEQEQTNTNEINPRLKLCLKHTQLYKKHYKNEASFGAMKKYYKAYLSGFPEASNIRKPLMESKSFEEAERLLLSFLNEVK